jgi:hypothetical protein
MFLGGGTHLEDHHVFSELQESKAKGLVQTNLCEHLFFFIVDFELVASSIVSFLIFLSEINVVCIGFHGLPIGLLKGGGVVSFS